MRQATYVHEKNRGFDSNGVTMNFTLRMSHLRITKTGLRICSPIVVSIDWIGLLWHPMILVKLLWILSGVLGAKIKIGGQDESEQGVKV